jgi:ADP-ribose pyrophosphatase YjhB (NUDIX family)
MTVAGRCRAAGLMSARPLPKPRYARFAEESGYRVRAVRLISAFDRDRQGHPPIPYHVYKLVFLCETLDETRVEAVDAEEVAFFGEHELPRLSLSRITPTQIMRFFEHHRRPDLPADFD